MTPFFFIITNYKKTIFWGLFLSFLFPRHPYAQIKIEIADKQSLVQLGAVAQPLDETDRKMALIFYDALETNNMDSVKRIEKYYFDKSQNHNTIQNCYSSLYWISKSLTANKDTLAKELKEPLYENLFHFFTDNNYENLKYFLSFRYHLPEHKYDKDMYPNSFYTDFLTLNTPIREEVEKTSEMMNFLPLKKGDKVVDVGCGLGYNTFKLANIVGNEGKVYATDIDSLFVKYLKQMVNTAKIKNIFPLLTSPNNIGVSDSVDAVYICGLFHHFYGRITETERAELYQSMKQVLKREGYLIIVDNAAVDNSELINFNIDKRLLMAHLAYWGFSYVDYKEFPPLSYVLIFKHTDEKVKAQTLYVSKKTAGSSMFLNIDSRLPLFCFAWQNINTISPKEKEAAGLAYDFFETGNIESVNKAVKMFDTFMAVENIDGEFAAIQWLCNMKNTSTEKRNLILEKNLLSDNFYKTMTNNNDSLIKYYLKNKYCLNDKEKPFTPEVMSDKKNKNANTQAVRLLENYVLTFNPCIKNADSIIENMNIKKNQIIIDLGLGQGTFSYLLSQRTGAQGKVYVAKQSDKHNQMFENFKNNNGIKNIELLNSITDSFTINEKADKIFLFSIYPKLYSDSEKKRQKFIFNIIKNLKPDGHLIVVDNGPVDNDSLPYQGSYISKKLIECQLTYYGFELIDDMPIFPHSFMLTFKLKEKKIIE